jgi:hypothetical protein
MLVRLIVSGFAMALPLAAQWQEIRSGQMTVLSDAGANAGREAANHVDQLRWAVGEFLGRTEPKLHWPLTVVVTKPGRLKGAEWGFGRDGWYMLWPAGGKPSRTVFRQFALQIVEDNLSGRMPDGYEEALADFVSTMDGKLARLTLGVPPPPAERTNAWAFLHMLGTGELTATRLRVLLSNLANGADLNTAWRNAYPDRPQPSPEEVSAYLKAGNFPTVARLGRPVDLERRYQAIPALPSRARLIPGDLLLAAGGFSEAAAAYRAALNERASPAGHEGLALSLLGQNQDAKEALAAATAEEGAGPRAFIELARTKPTSELARADLDAAAKLNPNALEVWMLAAEKEAGPTRRAYFLQKAVAIAPRRAALWQQLAMAQLGARQYQESEKSYRQALLQATDEERAKFEAERERFMQMRLDAEAAERKAVQDEERAELERLKREAAERIREAEAKANRAAGEMKSTQKVEQWWDGPKTESLAGLLTTVACQGQRARLTVQTAEGKTVQLVVVNAGQVVLLPAGSVQFPCGPQRPPRHVKIDYVPKPSGGSLGEVALIDFQ